MSRKLSANDIRNLLIKQAYGNQSGWAMSHGVSPSYVCDFLKHRREPGKKLLDALGLERIIYYQKRNGSNG